MLTDTEGLEVLVEEDCLNLLAKSSLGRIAVTIGAVPAIFPVNYHLLDGQILFRTGEGTKLHHGSDNAVVAFEVDEVDPVTHEGWSVLVVGVAREVKEREMAGSMLEQVPHPWAPGSREHVIAVVPEFVSGRRIVGAGRAVRS
jgi:nitroimidazol reductase NimA-like FMN-containing flavoprotein (pyridoxamine 5'-phosphate oxidase superfamily)